MTTVFHEEARAAAEFGGWLPDIVSEKDVYAYLDQTDSLVKAVNLDITRNSYPTLSRVPLVQGIDLSSYISTWQVIIGFSPVDGVFGPDTESATKVWQTLHAILPDGKVGATSWAAAGKQGVLPVPFVDQWLQYLAGWNSFYASQRNTSHWFGCAGIMSETDLYVAQAKDFQERARKFPGYQQNAAPIQLPSNAEVGGGPFGGLNQTTIQIAFVSLAVIFGATALSSFLPSRR
jgi:hypothetical protein